MVTQTQPTFRYCVDQADVIIDVDRWWLAFASENNAVELNKSTVVGSVLWDFISGDPTQTLYKEIHQHVRSSSNSVSVPFRCDSPTLQRHMQLTISNGEQGKLWYESKLLRTVPQPYVNLLDPKRKQSSEFLTMCSFCKRSLIEPSGWLELENISLKLRMYDKQNVPELRYTVCPPCARQLHNEPHALNHSAE
jgi:hypothetical protein